MASLEPRPSSQALWSHEEKRKDRLGSRLVSGLYPNVLIWRACIKIVPGRLAVMVAIVTQTMAAVRVDPSLLRLLDRFQLVGSRPGLSAANPPHSQSLLAVGALWNGVLVFETVSVYTQRQWGCLCCSHCQSRAGANLTLDCFSLLRCWRGWRNNG